MKPKPPEFSFEQRAAEKAASRADDEEKMRSGEVPRADMARINGGSLRGTRYVGPTHRIRTLADKLDDK